MEYGDLRVGDAVCSRQIVETWTQGKGHLADDNAIATDAAVSGLIRLFHEIGAFERRRGVHGDHHRHSVDRQRLVVGRTGATATAFVTGLRINQPGAERLQLVDQGFRRKLTCGVHRSCSLPVRFREKDMR